MPAVIFQQAFWLLLAPAALVPVAAWRLGRRRGRAVPGWSAAVQAGAVLLAVLALAQPAVRVGSLARLPWLVATDVSASTAAQAGRRELPWPEGLPRDDYAFAANLARSRADVQTGSTQAGPVLRMAASAGGAAAGLVLHTDGQFHDADWPLAASELGRTGLPVVIVPMDSPPPDAAVRRFRAARRPDGSVELDLSLLANADMVRTVRIERTQPDAQTLLVRRLELWAGQPASLRVTDRPPPDRAAWYRASFEPKPGSDASAGLDGLPGNDRAEAGLPAWRSRAAALGMPPVLLGPLGAALAMPVAALAEPASLPTDPAGWMDYAVVYVCDATGQLLPPAQRRALAGYVAQGGGLVLVGAGPHASLDDLADPLNQAAALAPNPFQRRPMRVVVALDASGSMAEQVAEPGRRRVKFDLAAEAVLSLQRHLTTADRLEVIAFAEQARRVYGPAGSSPAAPDFASVRRALSDVRPAGSTDIMKALAEATATPGTDDLPALVILLSDLEPTAYEGAPGRAMFDPAKAAAMFEGRKIRLAMVATLPPQAPPTPESRQLADLADRLGAPLVRQDRLTGLAEVFAGLVWKARGEAVRRGTFPLDLLGEPFGAAAAGAPALGAYIPAAPQGQEGSPAEVLARAGGDPVLARRAVGLGRSVTLAVPLASTENQPLARSPWLADLLARAGRWAMRTGDDPRLTVRLTRGSGKTEIDVSARDDTGWMNGLSLAARTTWPRAETKAEADLDQTGPGRYQATIPSPEAGTVAIVDKGGRTLWQAPAEQGVEPELAEIGANWDNLRRLAELTGGQVTSSQPMEIRQLTQRWARQPYTPVWAWVLGAALACVLAEWALTRVVRRT